MPLEGNRIDLEGHSLFVHRAGHTDRSDTTFVHVPELALVVAGGIVYNGVFPSTVAAALASKPRVRYPAGPTAARVSTLRRFVPARAFDKQIRKLNRLAG